MTGAKWVHPAERSEISQNSTVIDWLITSPAVDHKEASVSGANDRWRTEKRAVIFNSRICMKKLRVHAVEDSMRKLYLKKP